MIGEATSNSSTRDSSLTSKVEVYFKIHASSILWGRRCAHFAFPHPTPPLLQYSDLRVLKLLKATRKGKKSKQRSEVTPENRTRDLPHIRPRTSRLHYSLLLIGSLSNNDDDDGGNKNGKENGFRLAKQQLCTCITLFCTFLCRRCTSTTWYCLISRFVSDVNTRQRLPFSFLNFDTVL